MSVSVAVANTSNGAVSIPSTIFEMEEMLIECHELWRRSPGEAAWPFAGDGPWHLLIREIEKGEYGGDGQDGASSSAAPRTPLRTREVDRRDQVTAWLQLAAEPADRKLVWLATRQLHKGEGQIPWSALCEWLNYDRTARALSWRYRMVLALMVCAVRQWPTRRARELACLPRPSIWDEQA